MNCCADELLCGWNVVSMKCCFDEFSLSRICLGNELLCQGIVDVLSCGWKRVNELSVYEISYQLNVPKPK